MFTRKIEPLILDALTKYKALTLIGPRQSGKTTIAKKLFPQFEYRSLENPDTRMLALQDPRGFLSSIKSHCILDEIQRTPELLSYLQEILDSKSDLRKFILTGSNSLLLSNKVSQSLAGRSRILQILPLNRSELPGELQPKTIIESIFMGSYPRIFDENLNPQDWYGDYVHTYLEKDVRNLINIENLTQFDRMVRIVASRVGQLVNYSSMGNDIGISNPTAQKWLSVLQSSFICFTLSPHFRNFGKRLIKAPKIYFYDTGLLCYLLRIQNTQQLESHPLLGSLFENWILSEFIKIYLNKGVEPPFYFWRDQHGHEIDLVIDKSTHLEPVEIKLSETFNSDFIKNISWFNEVQKYNSGHIIYGGEKEFLFKDVFVHNWKNLEKINFFD